MLCSNVAIAAEEKVSDASSLKSPKELKPKPSAQQKLTIESKIMGSQEQPKVLYIMPWQGHTNPITIKDKEMQLTLPTFKPINPKTFKKEVRDFAVNQAQAKLAMKP